jgi:hypothetical protein
MGKHTLRTVPIEHDVFRSDIRHALHATSELARRLEAAGRAIHEAIAEASWDDSGDELRERAARLEGSSRQAMLLAADIAAVAGRLDGIALARVVVEFSIDAEQADHTVHRRSR